MNFLTLASYILFNRLWKSEFDVEIFISTVDISTESGCRELINKSEELGPVGGVFSLAATLDNEYFENMTAEKFGSVFRAKVNSAIHLDKITRQFCPSLDHFVVFSSVAGGRGSATQSNYAMANSVTERLIEKRIKDGFNGKAIQWGPIGGVGMLKDLGKTSFHGLELQPVSSCLEYLDLFLTSSESICSSLQFPHQRVPLDVTSKESSFESFMKYVGIMNQRLMLTLLYQK